MITLLVDFSIMPQTLEICPTKEETLERLNGELNTWLEDVREDHQDPTSRLIALPVTRIRAQSADPSEPIFSLEGVPASRT